MAKHRELAQIINASVAGKASSSRIWRTVVVAGAMLGAPLTAVAQAKAPPTPTAPAPTAKKEAPPTASRPATVAPITPAPPVAADKATAWQAAEDLVLMIEGQIKAHDTKVKEEAATNKLMKTDLQASLKKAKADAKKAEAEAKAEERAKNPPRPRVQESKPVGRGFILS